MTKWPKCNLTRQKSYRNWRKKSIYVDLKDQEDIKSDDGNSCRYWMKMKYFLQGIYTVCTKYCENRGWRTSVVDMNELQEDLKVILKLAVKMYMEL
jgi:hypothetical protein